MASAPRWPQCLAMNGRAARSTAAGALGGGDDLGAAQAREVERLRGRGRGRCRARAPPRRRSGRGRARRPAGSAARGSRRRGPRRRGAAAASAIAASCSRLGTLPVGLWGLQRTAPRRRRRTRRSIAVDVELAVDQRHFGQLAARAPRRSRRTGGRRAVLMTTRSPGSASSRSSAVSAATTSALAETCAGSTSQPSRSAAKPAKASAEPELGRRRVAAVVELDRLGERPLDRRRQREVHLGDPGGQHVAG